MDAPLRWTPILAAAGLLLLAATCGAGASVGTRICGTDRLPPGSAAGDIFYDMINSAPPLAGREWSADGRCDRYVALLGQYYREVFFEPAPVELVPPVAESDRWDDPAFARWQSRCPALALNMWSGPGRQGAGEVRVFGRQDFRLYELDADRDGTTPPQVIAYSERFYDQRTLLDREPGLPDPPPPDVNWNALQPPRSAFAPDPFGDHDGAFVLIDLDACKAWPLAWVSGRLEERFFDDRCAPVFADLLVIGGDPVIVHVAEHREYTAIFDLTLIAIDPDAEGRSGERLCRVRLPFSPAR